MKDYQEAQATVSWFSHRLDGFDPSLCPFVLWELFELGFRYELVALDRDLVPPRKGEEFEIERKRLLATVFVHYDLHVPRGARATQEPSWPSGNCTPSACPLLGGAPPGYASLAPLPRRGRLRSPASYQHEGG
ncbi:hypothetical protein BV20DRAFT_965752 [Pilatotrama ljubarskyi]|nr:hypothetical protein BV20DRAFT_965752 [Pilatotrama ljubarskyi]